MSSSKCARCEQTVYPVEGLRCLDKFWHKGCFKCQECNMTLNLKNYKGFEKKPYCNAHCPQAKATTVADTPESRRLAENTRIQSQAKYHEDFEKSKGKGFTAIADDPETLRLKNTSKIISNVAYHGELERKKQMEEKRSQSGQEEPSVGISNNNINNNNSKQQNKMHHERIQQDSEYFHHQQTGNNFNNPIQHPAQNQQQLHIQQQQMLQRQQYQKQQQQQLHLKQQQAHYAQNHNGQQAVNRQSQIIEPPNQQQIINKQMNYPQSGAHLHSQQQQQLVMQQHQHQMMVQQQRQAANNMPMTRQPVKQSIPPHLMKHQIMPQQQQMKYTQPMNDAIRHHHPSSPHLIGSSHMMHPAGGLSNGQRAVANPMIVGPQTNNHVMHGYNHNQMSHMNGVVPKQQQLSYPQARNMIHPNQMQPIAHHHQMRAQQIPHHHQQQQIPGRVFRAIYDYVANDVDEVSFYENDILIDCVSVDGNWLIGKVARSGQTGMLPANYVAEIPSQ